MVNKRRSAERHVSRPERDSYGRIPTKTRQYIWATKQIAFTCHACLKCIKYNCVDPKRCWISVKHGCCVGVFVGSCWHLFGSTLKRTCLISDRSISKGFIIKCCWNIKMEVQKKKDMALQVVHTPDTLAQQTVVSAILAYILPMYRVVYKNKRLVKALPFFT